MQRTQGNAAVLRALGNRGAGRRILQRALLHLVMNRDHKLFFGFQAMKYGYARRYKVPDGYHITIYPDQESSEYTLSDALPLKDITGYEKIQFHDFNVTHDTSGKHFYFDDAGNIVWAGTRREASVEHAYWADAIEAALELYADLGVRVTRQDLYNQLHTTHGRRASVGPRDTYGAPPTSTSTPSATSSSATSLKPRALLVPRNLRIKGPQSGAPTVPGVSSTTTTTTTTSSAPSRPLVSGVQNVAPPSPTVDTEEEEEGSEKGVKRKPIEEEPKGEKDEEKKKKAPPVPIKKPRILELPKST